MKRALTFLSLFTSSATLICCALPALLVTLGAGAALAGLVGNFPHLIWFSEHKEIVFSVGAILLISAGTLRWLSSKKACPIDPEKAAACQSSRDFSVWIYWVSVGIYMIGAFFAFLAPILF